MEDESSGFAGHLQVVKTDIVMQTLPMLILHNVHCLTYLGSNINLLEVLPMKPQHVNEVLFAGTSVYCCVGSSHFFPNLKFFFEFSNFCH
mgnify:CR=1 FL=1